MLIIKHAYEKASGKLHADNPNHPGITENDIEEVLKNQADVMQDHTRLWKWRATGPCQGRYPFLTVVFSVKDGCLCTITAHPPSRGLLKRYWEHKRRGLLCRPVQNTHWRKS